MKKKIIRSAIPTYLCALTWILCGMFLPMYKISSLLLAAGASVAVLLLSARLFPGRVVEEETAPDSGDPEVDRQIAEGRARLKALEESAAELSEERMRAPLCRMVEAGRKIFEALEKNPGDAQQIRKFMNYYLPTSVKLLEHYRTLAGAGDGANVAASMDSIAGSMDMIAGAFEKQLDRLYADDQLDVNAEIRALESMMAADGLTEDMVMRQGAQK